MSDEQENIDKVVREHREREYTRAAADGGMQYRRLVSARDAYNSWTPAQRRKMAVAARWVKGRPWPVDWTAATVSVECFPTPMAFAEAVEQLMRPVEENRGS